MNALGSLRRQLFGIPAPHKVFRKPGFAREAERRFGPVVQSLALGYNAALEDSSESALTVRLATVDPALCPFAYEGAGMGLGALDLVGPWKKRLHSFVRGPGAPHIYTVYVGFGLALARLRRNPEFFIGELDPLLRWGVVDGIGFHAGFFELKRYVSRKERPAKLSSTCTPFFDQGLGRSMWFSGGGVVPRVSAHIAGFQPDRHGDLWTGIGMASAFGGGADRAALEQLREDAGAHRERLAWGAAIAAWGRELAGNQAPHTDLACEVYSGLASAQAATILEQGRHDIVGSTSPGAMMEWRGLFTAALSGDQAHGRL